MFLPEKFRNNLAYNLLPQPDHDVFLLQPENPTGFIQVRYSEARTQGVLIYYVVPDHRGHNHTFLGLKQLVMWYRNQHPTRLLLHASVRTDNPGSIRTLEKSNFLRQDTRHGLHHYTYSIFR